MVITGYEVLETLHESELTLILRANRVSDQQPFVLKILNIKSPTHQEIAKFKHEYEILKDIQSNNYVPKIEAFEKSDEYYMIIFEDIHAHSLDQYLKKQTFTVEEFIPFAIELINALEYIHGKNLIHKDINPSNILWNKASKRIQLIDFGITSRSTREQQQMTSINRLSGTLAYLSPEQTGRMNRSIDYRSDYYSLGITFYEMLMGHTPFQTQDVLKMVSDHILKIPAPLSEDNTAIPVVISNIILKLLAKKAEDRYQTLFGLKKDMETANHALHITNKIDEFPIGKNDLSDKFEIPENLYGREAEIKQLIAAYERVCHGGQEIVLVSGNAGIGKSSFIHEIYQSIVKHKGYFIQGKFDAIERNQPYLALSNMIEDFSKQVLTEEKTEVEKWKNDILAAVGSNGRILINLAPSIKKIIGKQPPLVTLDLMQSENRFIHTIKQFMSMIADKDHPIVMFWDDMQWTDTVSLKLLESCIKERKLNYIFMIFAFRDNEVTASHPFRIFVDNVKRYLAIHDIKMEPLGLSSVKQMLSDTFHMALDQVTGLAELCIQKTNGNPFFLKEFLYSLNDQGSIYCDIQHQQWCWDLTEIQKHDIALNVVQLILSRWSQLNGSTRKALAIAACIGITFELDILAGLLNKPNDEVFQDLQILVNHNYLIPLKQASDDEDEAKLLYRFSHDKVREAAYSLQTKEENDLIHYQIAKIMLAVTPEAELDSKVIVIVDHLDKGIKLALQHHENDILIQLNLRAGLKAKAAQAYAQALFYFETAILLLSADAWNKDYESTLTLYTEAVEAAAYLGYASKMAMYSEMVTKNAVGVLDTVRIYRAKIFNLQGLAKPEEIVTTAIEALDKLDYHLPARPRKFSIIAKVIQARIASKRVPVAAMLNLPVMTDKRILAISDLLCDMLTAAARVHRPLFGLILAHLFILTTKYGISEASPLGCVGFGLINTAFLGNLDKGAEYGQLAVDLIKKYNLKTHAPRTMLIYTGFIRHTKQSYRESIEELLSFYQSALEIGNYEIAFILSVAYCVFQLHMGTQINDVYTYFNRNALLVEQFNEPFTIHHVLMHQQMIENLRHQSVDSHLLVGPIYDETTQIPEHYQSHDMLAVSFVYNIKILLACLYGNYAAAYEYTKILSPIINQIMTHVYYPLFLFYGAFTMINVSKGKSASEKRKLRKEIKYHMKKFKPFVESAPSNYLDKYYLLLAELANLDGDFTKAVNAYDLAIKAAGINEFTHIQAIANEHAAYFYYEHDKEKIGNLYLYEAWKAYTNWGAEAKSNQLQKDHPWLESIVQQNVANTSIISKIVTTTTSHAEFETKILDYNSILKASNIVTNELVLSDLIQRLLEVLSENLAAERCVLLLKTGDQLLIDGDYHIKRGLTHLMQSIALDPSKQALPFKIIQYVNNTHQSLVLDDAAKDSQFHHDQYIMRDKVKSVLCFPILYQSNLLGILYFENNSISGAFTSERLEFLQVLSSQIAISIKNARLYNSFERFVPKQFLKLLGRTDLIDVRLGDTSQKNITILFADIRRFTSLTESLEVDEIFKLLNQFLSGVEPIISKYNGFIDKYIGDAIMALFPAADDALQAAIEIQNGIKKFNQDTHNSFQIGIGISSGLSMLGTLGSEQRMDGTVISDAVNTASRIESLTKLYGTKILISAVARAQLKYQKYLLRYVDKVILRGKSSSLVIWESLDCLPEKVKARRLENLNTYQQAIQAYLSGDFEVAKHLFVECLNHDPNDKVSQRYILNCTHFIRNGTPAQWDGTTTLSSL